MQFVRGILSVLLCLAFASDAHATDIYLQLQRGEKVMVGLPAFAAKNPDDQKLARELEDVAKDDLLYTRLFNLTQQGPALGGGSIDFAGWEQAGADILITAHVSKKSDGSGEPMAQLIGAVYELPSGKVVFQKNYQIQERSARKLAHELIADFLYRFTGSRGVSQSRIVFSNNASGNKELYMMDYDGQNLKKLTNDDSLNILPRWSPDGKEIIYTSYRRNNPDLYILSLESGQRKALSQKRGLNSAASFSPNGKEIVLTLSNQGAPNLYIIDRAGNVVRRLTKGKSAETSASFSPDGRKIVYVSDKPGWPQIYIMNVDGTNAERVSDSGYCDAPVWSPTGDKIAYSRGTQRGQHNIVIYDIPTGRTFQLTDNAGNNENPSFSPDGRFVVFTSNRGGRRELYVAAVDGSMQRKLSNVPGHCFTPAWGP